MDISKIPAHILQDVRERGNTDADIKHMSAREVFSEYCNWNGLVNWGDTLFNAVESIKVASET